jgi:MoaA/NifB/PqqE/SkfB family radical SAM enzyme
MEQIMFEQTKRLFDLVKMYGNSSLTKKPIRYTHEITRRCNLTCPNCYVYNFNPSYENMSRKNIFNEVKKNELKYVDYIKIFEEEKSQGSKSIFLIGGEPTLRMDIIELAYNYFGRNVTLITNGLIKIPKNLKFPFAVSIDGGENVHDKIRGNGTWKCIFNNYSDDHRVMLSCCLRSGTTDQVQTVIHDWIDTNVFGVNFFFLTPKKGNKDGAILGKERDNVKNELHRVVDEYPNFVRMTHDLVDLLCEVNENECPVFRYSKWYDYKGDLQKNCLLGQNADCNLCGCTSPQYLKLIPRFWKFINKRTLNIFTLPRDIKQCRKAGVK